MVARVRKHNGLYAQRWLVGGGMSAPTGITKKHKINPDPERYLRHDLLKQPSCINLEEDDLTRLERTVSEKEAHAFEKILDSIDWQSRPSADFLHTIHLALGIGAYTAVQRMLALGTKYHPDNEQIQKYAHVLAPPRVTNRKVSPDPTIRANRDWLMAHGDNYRGKWICLRNGELLGSDDSFDGLIARIGDAKDILITMVF